MISPLPATVAVAYIDTEDDAGMMGGDAGRIYYWIRDQDLAAGAWDATWLILQC